MTSLRPSPSKSNTEEPLTREESSSVTARHNSLKLVPSKVTTSGSGRPSHVLAALGLSEREARSSIRLGFGRYTTEGELAKALTLISEAAQRQRSFAA